VKQSKIVDVIAWIVLVFAALGVFGGILIGTVVGALVWLVIGGCAVLALARQRQRRARLARVEQAAQDAVIAARAEHENQLYLDGDSEGLYGQYRPPS
jgi:Flp pilus assembly protein TadB